MPRTARTKQRKRLQLEMTVEGRERLEAIRDELGVSSLTDVVVRSVSLLDAVYKQTADGGRIFVRDAKDENERELVLVF